jgi:hypothetical protein
VCACEEEEEEEARVDVNEARGEDFSPPLEGSAAAAAVLPVAPKKAKISSIFGSSAILVESSFR